MPRDPSCVYVANNVESADIVVAWLAEHGVEAMVPGRHGISSAFMGLQAIVPGGVEVCLRNEADVARARALLAEHEEAIKARLPAGHESDMITVTCDKCGEVCEFPFDVAGRVAECPHCHEYIDVPPPRRE